jgi:hypothetical protein
MFPNPQDAFPLPPRPDLEQYKTLAKELIRACRSDDTTALNRWSTQWVAKLFQLHEQPSSSIGRYAAALEQFARERFGEGECKLAEAHFILARAHGFPSWPRFVKHLEGLSKNDSSVSAFEQAADAVVRGDLAGLQQLLREKPELIRERSTRDHGATLLHYVSANGVEGYRQQTPPNIVAIAEALLDAGAEVDAEADVYGGGATPLGLVATSTPPRRAGVQNQLLELLIKRGASLLTSPGRRGILLDCFANGCPEAAELLAKHGAEIELESAAALGQLDWVKERFNREEAAPSQNAMNAALRAAAGYGRYDVVAFLLEHGAELSATNESDLQTPLHWAVIGGHKRIVDLLLSRGASVHAVNTYGGTALGQAAWSAAHGGDADVYAEIIETLIAAGSDVPSHHPPVNPTIDALLQRHGSIPDPALWWYGEEHHS